MEMAGTIPENVELIPLEKLKSFLTWREKEFVEKYKDTYYNTENNSYSIREAKDNEGFVSIALLNNALLEWDVKASHPWMTVIEISYKSSGKGMPDKATSTLMNSFEEELSALIPDKEGYLNLGRETYKGKRTIYFACKEFRHVSKTIAALIHTYQQQININYEIYKDKYWKTMNRFAG
jgi:hypothetical protein